jgi:hypothetical protein
LSEASARRDHVSEATETWRRTILRNCCKKPQQFFLWPYQLGHMSCPVRACNISSSNRLRGIPQIEPAEIAGIVTGQPRHGRGSGRCSPRSCLCAVLFSPHGALPVLTWRLVCRRLSPQVPRGDFPPKSCDSTATYHDAGRTIIFAGRCIEPPCAVAATSPSTAGSRPCSFVTVVPAATLARSTRLPPCREGAAPPVTANRTKP